MRRCYLSIYLLFGILIEILNPIQLKSQESGPTQPEFSTFEPIDATDMVNLVNGDFTYSIPLLNVPGPSGGYPVNLHYHGGIKVNQDASWVGLGWNINTGSINRLTNGIPDDWNNKRSDIITYNAGDTEWDFALNVNFSTPSGLGISTGISFGSYKSLNGHIGLSQSIFGLEMVDVSPSISYNTYNNKVGAGMNLSFANNHNALNKGMGYGSLSYNTAGNSLNYSFYSVGFDLNSSFANAIKPQVSFPYQATSLSSADITSSRLSITVPFYIPLQTLFISGTLSYNRYKWHVYRKNDQRNFGVLYTSLAYLQDETEDDGFHEGINRFDVFEEPYGYSHEKLKARLNSTIYPAYDQYNVTGQGISGSISPKLFDFGNLPANSVVIETDEDGVREDYTKFLFSLDNNNQLITKNSNKIHFYFDYEFSTELTNDPIEYTISNPTISINGGNIITTSDNYNSSTERKVTGKYIEWYTNEEIRSGIALASGFIESDEIAQIRQNYPTNDDTFKSNFDPDGIGGYKITTEDGKTYHYSLPVYHFEEFTITEKKSNPKNEYMEFRKLDKYAYNWLLTAITGPDYVDNGEQGIIDDEDFGYWVKFDYGKWSDGYIWRSPYDDDKYADNHAGSDFGTHSFGRKQIYYLNAIKTKTHTAYFIKSLREDALGKDTYRTGEEGHYYVKKKLKMDDHYDPELSGLADGMYIVKGTDYHTISCNEKTKLLKLDEIILVQKGVELDYNNPSEQLISPSTGNIVIEGDLIVYGMLGGPVKNMVDVESHDVDFNLYYQENVLDKSDLHNIDLSSDIVKRIEFEQDYIHCAYTPNSEAIDQKKLGLVKLYTYARNNKSIIPPLKFDYYNLGSYSESIDNWGYFGGSSNAKNVYYKTNKSHNWSLKTITTQTGSKITIKYENDKYKNTAIQPIKIGSKRSFSFNKLEKLQHNQIKLTGEHLDNFTYDYSYYFGINQENSNDFYLSCRIENPAGNEFQLDCNNPGGYKVIDVNDEENYIIIEFNDVFECIQEFDEITFDDILINIEYEVINSLFVSGELNSFGLDNIYMYGGGIRVTSIEIEDEFDNNFSTLYDYTYPENNITSGIISYLPSSTSYIPWAKHAPSPQVMYEYITVSQLSNNMKDDSKTRYQFEVLKSQIDNNIEIDLGESLVTEEIKPLPNSSNISEEHYDFKIEDGSATIYYTARDVQLKKSNNLGRLLSVKTFNNDDNLLTKTNYEYYNFDEISHGKTQETFYNIKYANLKDEESEHYQYTSNSIIEYPSVLKSATTDNGVIINITESRTYDYFTGVPTVQISTMGDKKIKTVTNQAYNKYGSLGLKSINQEYFNMLTQQCENYQILLNSDETENGILAASIQTWNNDWTYRNFDGAYWTDVTNVANEKVWRKHQAYGWRGDLNENGTYKDFTEFDFDTLTNNATNGWQKINEISRYTHFSQPIEAFDLNHDYIATKYDNNSSLVMASIANANYNSFAYTGFEQEHINQYAGSVRLYDGEIIGDINNFTRIESDGDVIPHSGKYCINLTGQWGPKFTQQVIDGPVNQVKGIEAGRKYRASVWVHQGSDDDAALIVDMLASSNADPNYYKLRKDDASNIQFGDWILMNLDFEIPSNMEYNIDIIVALQNDNPGSNVYFDDFRVHPIDAPMNSFVYDEISGNVTAILDHQNIGTFYEYDEVGRLKSTWKGTPTGKKKVTEHYMNYVNNSLYTKELYPQFKFYGETKDVELYSTSNWTISDYSSWITVTPTSGYSGLEDITITCPAVELDGNREGYIKFSNEEQDFELKVIQTAGTDLPAVEVTSATIELYDKVTITWNPVVGAQNYKVYKSTDSSDDDPEQLREGWLDRETLTYDDKAVEPGVTYYYWVRCATDSDGTNISDLGNYQEGSILGLAKPVVTSVSKANYNDKIVINWEPVNGATHYMVYRTPMHDGNEELLGNWISETEWEDTVHSIGVDISQNYTYTYWVRAAVDENGKNKSAKSNTETGFITLTAPSDLTVTNNVHYDRIELSWSKHPGDKIYYRLLRNDSDDVNTAQEIGEWAKISIYIENQPKDSTEYVEPGKTYYYWIAAARDDQGNYSNKSSDSKEGSKKPLIQFDLIDNNQVKATTGDSAYYDKIVIKWPNLNESTNLFYRVYRDTSINLPDDIENIAITSWLPNFFEYEDNDVELNQEVPYFYWVEVATNMNGDNNCGLQNTSLVKGNLKKVHQVENFTASEGTIKDAIALNWEKPSTDGEYEYKILKRTGETGGTSTLNTISATNYEDRDCVQDIYYYYWIVTIIEDENNNKQESEPVGPILAYIGFHKPSLIDIDNTYTSIIIQWTPYMNWQYSKLYRKAEGEADWQPITELIESSSYEDTNILEDIEYSYSVRNARLNLKDQLFYSIFSDPLSSEMKTPIAPTPVASDNDPDKIVVSWNKLEGISHYQLWRNTDDSYVGDDLEKVVSWSDVDEYIDTNTDLFEEYFYFLEVAIDDAGTNKSESSSIIKGERFIIEPPVVEVSDCYTHTSTEIFWEEIDGATHYQVNLSSSRYDAGIFQSSWQTDTTYIDSYNGAVEPYYYIVKASTSDDNDNENISSHNIAVEGGFRKLCTPSNVQATNNETGKVIITWNSVRDGKYYRVYRNTSDNTTGIDFEAVSEYLYQKSTFTDYSGTQGTTYHYFVRASETQNDDIVSDYSSGNSGISQVIPKPEISDITKNSDYDPHKVRIEWSAVANAPYYKVYRSTSSSSLGDSITSNWLTSLYYEDVNATAGVNYYYSVVASVNEGASESEPSDPELGRRYKLLPPNLTANNCGDHNSITLTWSASTAASHYNVYKLISGSYQSITDGWITNLSMTDNGANNYDSHYEYKIRSATSSSGANASDSSDVVSGTPALCAPNNVQATSNLFNQVNISWSGVSNASHYNVYRDTDQNLSNGYTSVKGWVTGTSTIDYNATPNTGYYYLVVAAYYNGTTYLKSEESSYDYGKLLNLAPPTDVSATDNVYCDKVIVNWSSVSSNSYSVYRSLTSNGTKTEIRTWTGLSTFPDESATPGQTYYYFVKAKNTNGDISDYSNAEAGNRSTTQFTIDKTSLNFPGAAGANFISVTSSTRYSTNEALKIDKSASWFSVLVTSPSDYNYSLKVQCQQNTGQPRSGHFYITVQGHKVKVNITQQEGSGSTPVD